MEMPPIGRRRGKYISISQRDDADCRGDRVADFAVVYFAAAAICYAPTVERNDVFRVQPY